MSKQKHDFKVSNKIQKQKRLFKERFVLVKVNPNYVKATADNSSTDIV